MFEELVGQCVRDLRFENDGSKLIIKTDKYKYTFVAEGDCCAVSYVLEPEKEDLKAFLGNEIIQATSSGVSVDKWDDYGQTDTEFYNLRTHNGDLNLELRTEHNGYYSGWLMMVGREEIWPVFDDIREKAMEN
tara:strand:- start:290 stop:688 length:399 start_codon:yes stop_codon:yes gene_type:complete